ncbi:Uncharacterized protein SCF082_LOCUS40114, partial [Durusdinium trenchii]
DGMDQSKWSIPRCRGDRYSKTFEQLERPRIKVHGLWCHYRELMFFCADPRTAADSDFIIECAARGLERIAAQCRESGAPMPTEVTIWCDNTVRESKNTWVLTFLSALVLKMKMKFAALCMSMVGHTHGCLDQIYGQLTVCFRYCSVLLDCDDVCSKIKDCLEKMKIHRWIGPDCKVHCEYVKCVRDWKSWLSKLHFSGGLRDNSESGIHSMMFLRRVDIPSNLRVTSFGRAAQTLPEHPSDVVCLVKRHASDANLFQEVMLAVPYVRLSRLPPLPTRPKPFKKIPVEKKRVG